MMSGQYLLMSFLIAAFSFGAPAQDAPPTGAKEAFYDPQQPPPENTAAVSSKMSVKQIRSAKPPILDYSGRRIARSSPDVDWLALGLNYWIELKDDLGASHNVTDQQVFKSGDRIRIHFRANSVGRIQIMQIGASGQPTVLFPDATRGAADNLLHVNEERILPAATTWFKFDNHAGIEKLFIMFAKTQEELEHVAPLQASFDAHAQAAALSTQAPATAGAKDLMIETETEHASEVGTYAVSPSGKPIVLQIVLKHR